MKNIILKQQHIFMILNKVILVIVVLIILPINNYAQEIFYYNVIKKDTFYLPVINPQILNFDTIIAKSGCFIPYFKIKKKKKLNKDDCLEYDLIKKKDIELLILPHNKSLINFISLNDSNGIKIKNLVLNQTISMNEIKEKYKIVHINEGINMLQNKKDKYFNDNKETITHCYIKTKLIKNIQLIFVDNYLKYIYIFPDSVKYKWEKD